MQITPDYSSITRQQLTPASSVDEDTKPIKHRSVPDSQDDDYYFYHSGRGMTERRGSVQSIGRRPDDEENTPQPVTLPPIPTLFAAVERCSNYSPMLIFRCGSAPPLTSRTTEPSIRTSSCTLLAPRGIPARRLPSPLHLLRLRIQYKQSANAKLS